MIDRIKLWWKQRNCDHNFNTTVTPWQDNILGGGYYKQSYIECGYCGKKYK